MSYVKLAETGELKQKIKQLYEKFSPCTLCPLECGALRNRNKRGLCGGRRLVSVSSYLLHFGEEPPVSGTKGSGTVFFKGCTLGCSFCQNHQISRRSSVTENSEYTAEELASMLLELQNKGAHNINLVTPDHFLPQILEALEIAASKGLKLPLVYNASGFEKVDILKILDGVVDIYMPDLKWLVPEHAAFATQKPVYAEVVKDAIAEMWNQVGKFTLDENGIAFKGLLIRHLVLPEGLSDSWQVLEFIRPFLKKGAAFSLMSQYNPPFENLPAPLNKTVSPDEYYPLAYELRTSGYELVFIQEPESAKNYNPDFSKPEESIFS